MTTHEAARRYVLSRIDPRRATAASVVAACAAAGIHVTTHWATEWLAQHTKENQQ